MIQRGILLREKLLIEDEKSRTEISVNQLSKELVPLVLAQWHRSNAKFSPPVVIQSKSLANKIERLWKRVENVAWGRSNKSETEKVIELLDRLLDVNVCSCVIRLCDDPDSECPNAKTCSQGAHVKCSCPLQNKLPVLDLKWLYYQRSKKGEASLMGMGGGDYEETKRQVKAEKRKAESR